MTIYQLMSNLLLASIKIQSALHTLEEIDIKNDYKRNQKKNLNDVLCSINRFMETQDVYINEITKTLSESNEQTDFYVECVKKFDELGKTFNLSFESK
jgi:hypothetical protein